MGSVLVPSTSAAPPAAAADTQYIPALTGIRALAAYMVFWHHYEAFRPGAGWEWLTRLREESYVGVSIFFVLSGFLLALRYFDSANFAAGWWRKYLVNRVARIYPMYFLLTALTVVVDYYRTGEAYWLVLLLNFTLLKGFFEGFSSTLIHQAWTLTVEECFYFTAPVAFWLIRNHRLRLWTQPPLLLAVGLGLMHLAWAVGIFNFLGYEGNYKFIIGYTFFGRATEFYVGIQFARWYQTRPAWRLPITGLLTAVGAALVVASIFGLSAVRGAYPFGCQAPAGMVINNLLLPVAVALLFYGLLTERTWLQWFFASAPLQVLGKSSYVFYLIHIGVINTFIERTLGIAAGWPRFGLLVLVSIALYYAVEHPLHRRLRRAFGGGR